MPAKEQGQLQVEVAEYDCLRREIDNRTTLSHSLIALELATLGVGLSVLVRVPDVLLGLASVSSFLWLYWIDHANQIHKIASYIALEIGPRLSIVTGDAALLWERYLRRLESGGATARAALFGRSQTATKWELRESASDRYTMLLFGGTAPVLVIAYVVGAIIRGDRPLLLLIPLSAIALALWIYAIWRFVVLQRTIKIITSAIIGPPEEVADTSD